MDVRIFFPRLYLISFGIQKTDSIKMRFKCFTQNISFKIQQYKCLSHFGHKKAYTSGVFFQRMYLISYKIPKTYSIKIYFKCFIHSMSYKIQQYKRNFIISIKVSQYKQENIYSKFIKFFHFTPCDKLKVLSCFCKYPYIPHKIPISF